MHVLYVTFAYKPAEGYGGPVHSVAALAEGLVARGHRVSVFTTDAGLPPDSKIALDQPVLVDGVSVTYFRRHVPPWAGVLKRLAPSGGYWPTPAISNALRRIISSVHLVHTHAPYTYATNIAGRMAIHSGIPLFYSPRGAYHPEMLQRGFLKKWIFVSLFERQIMKQATGLVALSPREVTSLQALRLGVPCYLVPNGVDVVQFRRVPRAAVSPFGISEHQLVILFLGRLHAGKGVELLVNAFSKIADAHPRAVLVCAGEDQDGYITAWQTRLRQRGHESRVIFTGNVSGEDKLDLLARSDLFVLPSISEGQSMALLEALASGTPALISAGCDFDIVAESGAGWIVGLDVEHVAAALSRLLSDPGRLKIAADRAFGLARSKLGWATVLTHLETIYWESISRKA